MRTDTCQSNPGSDRVNRSVLNTPAEYAGGNSEAMMRTEWDTSACRVSLDSCEPSRDGEMRVGEINTTCSAESLPYRYIISSQPDIFSSLSRDQGCAESLVKVGGARGYWNITVCRKPIMLMSRCVYDIHSCTWLILIFSYVTSRPNDRPPHTNHEHSPKEAAFAWCTAFAVAIEFLQEAWNIEDP